MTTCGTCNGDGKLHITAFYKEPCHECARREGRAEGLREVLAIVDEYGEKDPTHPGAPVAAHVACLIRAMLSPAPGEESGE